MDDLAQAIALTHALLDAVERRHWDELAGLEARRQPLIAHYFQANTAIDAVRTEELKLLNDRIVGHLQVQRDETRRQQLALQRGNHASRAYLDAALD